MENACIYLCIYLAVCSVCPPQCSREHTYSINNTWAHVHNSGQQCPLLHKNAPVSYLNPTLQNAVWLQLHVDSMSETAEADHMCLDFTETESSQSNCAQYVKPKFTMCVTEMFPRTRLITITRSARAHQMATPITAQNTACFQRVD